MYVRQNYPPGDALGHEFFFTEKFVARPRRTNDWQQHPFKKNLPRAASILAARAGANQAYRPQRCNLLDHRPENLCCVPKASASASESAPQVSATHSQNVLNVGASPQEVIEAQRVAANQAAQAVAERAQVLHNEAIAQLEGQVHDVAQATFQEASVTVEQLRHELQVSEAKPQELIDLGRVLEQQAKECRAELTEAEAELNAVRFQLSQARIEAQVKDREIHRLRQAAPSATGAIGSPKAAEINLASASGHGVSSGDSVPQPTFPASDPRVDELIEAVQQLASRLEQPHGTDQGVKLDPVQDNAAGFRTWRNALLVQIAKSDHSGQNLVHRWLSEAFQLDREDLLRC